MGVLLPVVTLNLAGIKLVTFEFVVEQYACNRAACRLTKTTSVRSRSASVVTPLGLPLGAINPCTRWTNPNNTTRIPCGVNSR